MLNENFITVGRGGSKTHRWVVVVEVESGYDCCEVIVKGLPSYGHTHNTTCHVSGCKTKKRKTEAKQKNNEPKIHVVTKSQAVVTHSCCLFAYGKKKKKRHWFMGKPSRESVFSRRLLFGGLWPQNKSADLRRKPLRFQDVGAAAAFYSCHRDATVFTFEFIYLKKKGGGGVLGVEEIGLTSISTHKTKNLKITLKSRRSFFETWNRSLRLPK